MELKAIVLAAGQGKRLRASEVDNQPKVMKRALGRPLLRYVLSAIDFIGSANTYVVVGFGRGEVMDFCAGFGGGGYNIAVQERQLGTGDAVGVCAGALGDYGGATLVCYGDTPLIRTKTYRALIDLHFREKNACTMLTTILDDPAGYGRVVRDADGGFADIVEQRDCTPEQRAITEINSGIYVFDNKKLFSALARVTPDNDQKEYYLTDVPKILRADGEKIGLLPTKEAWQTLGVNTPEQLEQVERLIREKEQA